MPKKLGRLALWRGSRDHGSCDGRKIINNFIYRNYYYTFYIKKYSFFVMEHLRFKILLVESALGLSIKKELRAGARKEILHQSEDAKARPEPGLDQRLNYGKRRLVELKSGGGMGEERLEAKNVHRPMPPCNPSPFCIVSPRTALMVPAPYIFVGEATCTWHEETRHLGSGFCVAIGQF